MTSRDAAAKSRMFPFALRPLDDIDPWGEPGNLSLHWFALTDGYYFLRFGDAEILRYDRAACEAIGWELLAAPDGFWDTVDYPVARLFHDMACLWPSILEPVPPDLSAVLRTPESLRAWETRVRERDPRASDEALQWIDDRTLDHRHRRTPADPDHARSRHVTAAQRAH